MIDSRFRRAGWQRQALAVLALACLACATVPPPGQTVEIADESAVIVWDEATRTEHFVRRAAFRTGAKDFGFLVPTPAVPQFGEVDDLVFKDLERITAPAIVVQKIEGGAKGLPMPAPAPAAAPVTVVAQAKVSGYDAVVLEARDARALRRWLVDNGYAASPELDEWLKAYVDQGWKISAFKIAQDGGRAESKAVRMSFASERPFYPYREPKAASAGASSRLLRVFFVADRRYSGTLGANADWPAAPVWAGPLMTDDAANLMETLRLPKPEAGRRYWLSEFEDRSSPRPATDEVFFRPATDPSTLSRPATIIYERDHASPSVVGFFGTLLVLVGLIYGTVKLLITVVRRFRGRGGR